MTPAQVRRRAARREKAGITYRIALAFVAFAAATVQGLVSTRVWTTAPKWLPVGLVIALAAATARDNIFATQRRLSAPAIAERQVSKQKAVVSALVSIADHVGAKVEDLGVSVFEVQKHGIFRKQSRLVRTVRFRLTDAPQPSEVDWVVGKGVIGECWETKTRQHTYWKPIADRHANRSLTAQDYEKIKPATRQGFSREEFVTMLPKYAEVLAVPIKNDHGVFLGCVSVDLAMRSALAIKANVLSGPVVEEYVSTAARVVAQTLSES